MKVRWMVAGLVLWIMHGVVYADAAQLQMNEAFRLALTHPSVVARSSELGAAQQRLVAAQWQRFPTLSALTGKDQSQNGYATVRLDQPLWTGGRITAGIDSAEASVRGAEAAVLESHQDILTRAVAAFTEFGRLHTRMVTSRSNVAEHERLYKLIDRRVQSEVSSSSDGVLARARLAAARAELGQFEAQSGRARSQLEQIVGRSFERIELPAMPSLRQKTLLEMTDAALEYSPALRRRTAEEEAAQAEIGIRQGNLWPQVKARYERTNGSTLMAREQVYIALEYQPGAGMSSLSGVQEAVARREAAQAVRETARRELLDTIATDWASYQSLKSQGRDQLAQVESTSDVFDSFVRQYAVGRKSWIDVLNAQRELVSARYALADVEWGMMRDTLRLQIFSGELSAANLGGSAGNVLVPQLSEGSSLPAVKPESSASVTATEQK